MTGRWWRSSTVNRVSHGRVGNLAQEGETEMG
jgi:hypothetical protein